MPDKIIGTGITFDDVLLVPARSAFLPAETDVSTRLTKKIRLNIPIVSAAMDTVTEAAFAIAIAGRAARLHPNMPPGARPNTWTWSSAASASSQPDRTRAGALVRDAQSADEEYGVSGVPITDKNGVLVGILTRATCASTKDDTLPIREVMTSKGWSPPRRSRWRRPSAAPHEHRIEASHGRFEQRLRVDHGQRHQKKLDFPMRQGYRDACA
jgi:IMP dehydrogenase